MLSHLIYKDLFLFRPQDYGEINQFCSPLEIEAFETVLDWAKKYLCNPHSQLGRKGDVCPFVKSTLKHHNSFYLTCYRGSELNTTAMVKTILAYRNWFSKLPPQEGKDRHYKAILILFPEITVERCAEIIDPLHAALKPRFVKHGLMFGQFYPNCSEPGLHNPDFKPLHAPVTMLVIRHMQLTDIAFLSHQEQFIRAYCNTFNIGTREELDMRVIRARIPQLPTNWETYIDRVFPTAK